MRILDISPSCVLAIYAHPDDADVAAGGVLAMWAHQGCDVHLVVVCDGAKGSHTSVSDAAPLRGQRQEEMMRAAEILGVSSVTSLERPDGEIDNNVELRRDLVSIVRRLRPDVVLSHDPTSIFFGGVYINHRDHRETGWATLDAVAPAAAMPLYFPHDGEPHRVETLLLSGSHEPDVVAEIASSVDTKAKAVAAHESQVGSDEAAIVDAVYERAAQAGRAVGTKYGEPFRFISLFA